MLRKLGNLAAAALVSISIMAVSCGDDKTTTEEIYLLYSDIYGVVEYEADGDYPPPFDHDNLSDDNIIVTLYFGETIDFYQENDVYGYFISYDDNTDASNEENFNFPFVPSGQYWLDAEFTILDSCFYAKTSKFTHTDTSHTFQELLPVFLGTNRGCWSVDLAGVSDDEMVQVSERCWVSREVYENIYKPRLENGSLVEP
ncbi:MAG: hypothetical protein FVQ81_17950 [Candidatus Glassbacteria bacterium]|nr:hypothetical protein [Candidatus Glassbacteria bacterium]